MRVALQLDTRIALEAIILNRLQRIPANRRQEWLRGLLVQGFRQECQAPRGTMDETQQPAAMAFTQTERRDDKFFQTTRWPYRIRRRQLLAAPANRLQLWAGDRLGPRDRSPANIKTGVIMTDASSITPVGLDDGYAYTKVAHRMDADRYPLTCPGGTFA